MELIELLKEKNNLFEEEEIRLVVYDNVDLSYSELKELPNCYMKFWGSLNLSHTQIEELPDYTIIIDYLDINGTSITKIPKNLIANRIYTPVKGRFVVSIEKDGRIRINGLEKSIAEWEKFFKERRYFSKNIRYASNVYEILEQNFKKAKELYESWRS